MPTAYTLPADASAEEKRLAREEALADIDRRRQHCAAMAAKARAAQQASQAAQAASRRDTFLLDLGIAGGLIAAVGIAAAMLEFWPYFLAIIAIVGMLCLLGAFSR